EFMPFACVVEAEELREESIDTHARMLYQVANFTTKINLLNSLMADDEVFDKVVIFVNTRNTAENLIKRLQVKKEEVSLLPSLNEDELALEKLTIFKRNTEARILFIANEDYQEVDLKGVPFIFHFEVPENIDLFVKHVIRNADEEAIAITFATDIELPEIKKIEQILGKKIPVTPLPDDLIVYLPHNKTKEKTEIDESRGGAFHQKKESNNKTYNYGGGTKAKMTMKNKKR
ncbi:MAG: DEAD/DEAH box helicase, partial [Sphingobacterium sp.]